MAWIGRTILAICATIKNFILDLFIPMSHDIVFGKVCAW